MQKISMLLFLALFLLSCQPEEDEFTDLNLTVRTGIQVSKEKNEANRIRVRNIEALRKLPFPNTKNRKEALVLGYYEPGDDGGGIFYWDPISTEKDNGGTIIAFDSLDTGRWKRIFEDPVNVKWFGAKGDGITEESNEIQNAIDSESNWILIPTGHTSLVGSTIYLPSDIKFQIDGELLTAPNTVDDFSILKNSDRKNYQKNIQILGTGYINGNKQKQKDDRIIRQVCIDLKKVENSVISVAKVGNNKWDNKYQQKPLSGISAAIRLRDARFCRVSGVFLYKWEKEGILIDTDSIEENENCYGNIVSNIIAEGSGSKSYSGIQVGGVGASNNIIRDVLVKDCGASGVGMDSKNSKLENITIYRNGYYHGINIGHRGAPSNFSSAKNLKIFNAGNLAIKGIHNGINIVGGTSHFLIKDAIIEGAFTHGVNISDGAKNIVLINVNVSDVKVHGFNLFNADSTNLLECTVKNFGAEPIFISGTSTEVNYKLFIY